MRPEEHQSVAPHQKKKIGILAFGSLIGDPGPELAPKIILRAAFNECVNSGEIPRDPQFAYFKKPETTVKMNAAKLKVLETVNKVGNRYSLEPIRMNHP